MRHVNPSGNIYYDTEEELKEQLEKFYLRLLYGPRWKPKDGVTKEVWLSDFDRIDYYGNMLSVQTYIEVKNWFVTKKDMDQILRYKHIIENNRLIVICGGIDKERRAILKDKFIDLILVKDIKEIDPEELAHWY